MSDLTTFADHARAMADAQHKPECCIARYHVGWGSFAGYDYPDPACPGCVTDADRALWTRLADEADAWLARDDEEGLFDAETPVVERDSRSETVDYETKRGPDRANESDPLATVSTTAKGA